MLHNIKYTFEELYNSKMTIYKVYNYRNILGAKMKMERYKEISSDAR